jgi:hypothetical protein
MNDLDARIRRAYDAADPVGAAGASRRQQSPSSSPWQPPSLCCPRREGGPRRFM